MALNFQQVYEKIREIGKGTGARRARLEGLRRRAAGLFGDYAGQLDYLRAKVDEARRHDPSLRCAYPAGERLDASVDLGPVPSGDEGPLNATLIAADGSQIAPDRHAALGYSLVNVGAVVMAPRSGQPPEVFTDSQLLYGEELYTRAGARTEEQIALERDIAERRKLLDLAKGFPGPIVALTDGPVELWGAKGGEEEDYRRNLEVHTSVLSQLQSRGVTVAGYVDKPGADLVVRLLEIVTLTGEQMKEVRGQHPLRGVSDRWLYGGVLKPGHRSAVFGLQSGSRVHYAGTLALHFFYLNVGGEGYPSLVRVEIPKWVADDAASLNLLHAALLEQCRIMGARPYPYILHRAHEVAVVTYEERRQIEQMLALELLRCGDEVEGESNKQSAKSLPGRRGRK